MQDINFKNRHVIFIKPELNPITLLRKRFILDKSNNFGISNSKILFERYLYNQIDLRKYEDIFIDYFERLCEDNSNLYYVPSVKTKIFSSLVNQIIPIRLC